MSRTARLGAFIFVTLAILAVGTFIIGSRQYLFTSTYRLKALFSNVVGLDVGAGVRVGGVQRGTVHSIDLPHRPGEKITVVMDLDSQTHDIIKQDSVASIETEGMLGNEYMAISFGTAGSPNVLNGDTLSSQPPIAMSDLIKKSETLLDSSQQAIQNITLTTANLGSITGKIDKGQGTIGELVNDKTTYVELNHSMAGVSQVVDHAQAGVTDFQENMEALKHNFFLRGYFKNRGYEDSAELAKDEITSLPSGATQRTFTFEARQLFDKVDTAKLKNQKSLDAAGDFLTGTDFGVAVVAVYSSMEGDSSKDLTLAQGRALVIREYLVENFGFDDRKLKTLGMGKKTGTSPESGWGSIQILVYPAGTEMPAAKMAQNATPSMAPAELPIAEAHAAAPKTQ
jgi:phospholipid/cholesterol/gamma-HCH transport system substrate-binding protein